MSPSAADLHTADTARVLPTHDERDQDAGHRHVRLHASGRVASPGALRPVRIAPSLLRLGVATRVAAALLLSAGLWAATLGVIG